MVRKERTTRIVASDHESTIIAQAKKKRFMHDLTELLERHKATIYAEGDYGTLGIVIGTEVAYRDFKYLDKEGL